MANINDSVKIYNANKKSFQYGIVSDIKLDKAQVSLYDESGFPIYKQDWFEVHKLEKWLKPIKKPYNSYQGYCI